jgi:hypothetical protein
MATKLMNDYEASSSTMMKQARDLFEELTSSCTEPHAREAHEHE